MQLIVVSILSCFLFLFPLRDNRERKRKHFTHENRSDLSIIKIYQIIILCHRMPEGMLRSDYVEAGSAAINNK